MGLKHRNDWIKGHILCDLSEKKSSAKTIMADNLNRKIIFIYIKNRSKKQKKKEKERPSFISEQFSYLHNLKYLRHVKEENELTVVTRSIGQLVTQPLGLAVIRWECNFKYNSLICIEPTHKTKTTDNSWNKRKRIDRI